MITKKQRLEYLILTLVMLFMGAVLYGVLAFTLPPAALPLSFGLTTTAATLFNGVVLGLLGGYMIGSIFSGILLAVRFFKNRGLAFKIVAAVLWPVTMICIIYFGIFSFIPYGIYNLVKLCSQDGQNAV